MKNQTTRTYLNVLSILIVTIALASSGSAQSKLKIIVDRGLPTINLNDAAGESRSNASLGLTYNNYFFGDDFIMPPPSGSKTWRIDTIRVWVVGGPANNDGDLTNDTFLGDQSLGDLTLWIGTDNDVLTKVAEASFLPGSDETNSPDVIATRVQYSGEMYYEPDYIGALDYENLPVRCIEGNKSPPGYSTIVQIDFTSLSLTFPAGTLVRFGILADGEGVNVHSSNAFYSGAASDSADDWVHTFMLQKGDSIAFLSDTWGNPSSTLFDKSMDANVQVFAAPIKKGGGK